jgi:hypothetical protein
MEGDTVLVQPGIYPENINFYGKNIVVGSLMLTTGDTSYISQTVINGSKQIGLSVAEFSNGENSSAILCGFTITGGRAYYGGGIYVENGSPSLKYLHIIGNVALWWYINKGGSINRSTFSAYSYAGGGMYFFNSTSVLENLHISRNSAGFIQSGVGSGGGIHVQQSNLTLLNVTVCGNSTYGFFDDETGIIYPGTGSGIAAFANSDLYLVNVTLSGNTHHLSEGIELYSSASRISMTNTIVWNNHPEATYFLSNTSSNSMVVAYSDIFGGQAGIVTNNNGAIHWLDGNIDTNPIFVDSANCDFRLQPGSPCIDAGIQDTFLVYNNNQDTLLIPPLNFLGNAPDMGAHEYDDPAEIGSADVISNRFVLYQNYPNPFNPSTTIRFQLSKSTKVILKIYNILGQQVRSLINEAQSAGEQTVIWDGRNEAGLPVNSGTYLFRLQAGNIYKTGKMVLVR